MNFYVVGNSLPNVVCDAPSKSHGLKYVDRIKQDEHNVQVYAESNAPIIACAAKLVDWKVEEGFIVIHAGVSEMTPINKKANLKMLIDVYKALNPDTSEAVYFYRVIKAYASVIGNKAYMDEWKFWESCFTSRFVLDEIPAEKIIIGIGYISPNDWRYPYLSRADKTMKVVFGDLHFLDLFQEHLKDLIGTDGVHLTAKGHEYVYHYIMEVTNECGNRRDQKDAETLEGRV